MKKACLFLALLLCLTSLQAQVIINEICPDAGNYDGQGAEWTELFNTTNAPVDLSCYVLTDGEEIVVFPTGTYIPANGYLVVYNSTFFNTASGNWDPAISILLDNVGSLSSPDPDGVTSINVASCNCTNQTGCFSVTWNNSSATSGNDRVALFNASGIIVSGVYWGNGDANAASNALILESTYATGPNTANLNITGTAAGCNLPVTNNYDLPALTNAVWQNTGGSINGCTTSKSRVTNSSLTWIDDNWPTPGANNANPNNKVTYSLNGGTAIDITNTDNIIINACAGATLAFNGEVYDYNQVYNTAPGDNPINLEGGSQRKGSHIDATGGLVLTDAPWVEAAVNAAGTTILSYGATPTISANTTFKLFIKENTQGISNFNANASGCAAEGPNINGSGAAEECYVLKTITLNIIQPLVSASFTCTNGFIRVTALPATATGLTYNLINSVTPALNQSNTIGQFQVTSGIAANYSVQVVQNPACGVPLTATGAVCVFTPPCPTFTAYDACATAAGPICPGSNISLSLTGTNLPNGGKVEWVNDTNNDGNVYDESASAVVATQDITTTTTTNPIPNGAPKLNEVIFNATTETSPNFGEGWEIAGTPGTNIGCSYFTDGDFVLQLPSSAVIPASGFYVVGTTSSNNSWSSVINFSVTSTSITPNLTNGGEYLAYFSASNVFINGTVWGSPSTANSPSGTATPTERITGAGCASLSSNATIAAAVVSNAGSFPAPTTGATTDEQSIELSADLGTTWQISAAPGSAVNTMGSTNAPSSTTNTTLAPTCVTYTVPSTACNTTINLKPRISPAQVGCTGGSATPTLATRAFTITCPTASISGQAAICSGTNATIPVSLANFGNNTTATVSYNNNGGATVVTPALPITNGTVVIPNITTAGVYNLTGVSFAGGTAICNASASGNTTITVASNPDAPTTSTASVCTGSPTTINISGGGPAYNWFSNAALTTQVGTGNPLYYTATASGNTTLYVQSIDPDNGCKSASASVVVTATATPELTIPASIDCNSGSFSQTATGGSGTLTYTLVGYTGGDGSTSAVGASNVTGNFSLSGTTGATILVKDVNGCYDIETYDFLAAPYNCGGALPLSFTTFSVAKNNTNVTINWQTADDLQVKNYTIERSITGLNFTPLNTVTSKQLAIANYVSIDSKPLDGINYYRIKAAGINGTVEFSSIKSVRFNNKFVLQVYPNPVLNNIQVINNNTGAVIVTVTNAKGGIMYNQTVVGNNISINSSTWSAGVYVIKLTDKVTNDVQIQKIIKK